MEVRNAQFTSFIDVLTTNTYVMVIVSDPTIRTDTRAPHARPWARRGGARLLTNERDTP